ncbi:MAG TPA: hypothetical protein VFO85_06660, partial [Vicinamibacteria bacterium]|nr:hypothetical protein [Vicinamibacteria bacterium]
MKGRLQFVLLAVMFAGGAMWLGEGRAAGSGGPQLPAPDYDSGWVAVVQSGTLVLEHNLDTSTDYMMVDLQFKASPQLGLAGINNQFYGTSPFGAPPYISG